MKIPQEILLSLSFVTRLPLWRWCPPMDSVPLSQLVWTFPIAGAILGLACGAFFQLLIVLGLATGLAAIFTVAFQLWLTGALHEDGLADTADGFAGGRNKEQRLVIMRDSRIGSFGALALIISIMLRVYALTLSSHPALVMLVFVAAGAMSRAMMAIGMFALPNARADGLAAWAGKPTPLQMYCSVILACVITLTCFKTVGLGFIAAALIVCDIVCIVSKRKIEGITGDVYGTLQQCVEVIILIVATVLVHG